VKTGAEGFFAAMIPELGFGIALKIDDGAGRASETTMAAILDKFGLLGDDKAAHDMLRAPVTNTRNTIVGERRPAARFGIRCFPKCFARGGKNAVRECAQIRPQQRSIMPAGAPLLSVSARVHP
jgi:hypothetical protein